MEDKATLTNECCPYMHAQGTKFDDITRVGSEFLQYDLPSNAIKVIGCSRKTQGMVSFHLSPLTSSFISGCLFYRNLSRRWNHQDRIA